MDCADLDGEGAQQRRGRGGRRRASRHVRLYSGQAGSSENTYASIVAEGALASWNGATGSNTIDVVLGYALYNTAAVFFIDAQGRGHVMVIGGASRSSTPQPSAGVVYY